MDQNNNVHPATSTTITDILRLFKGKLKLLICLTVIGAVLGACVGALVTTIDAVYGGDITFYITPSEEKQALLPILQSESFAEKLLLDENGLPPKAECNATDYQAALDAVQREQTARENCRSMYLQLTMYPYSLAMIEDEYNNYVQEYNRVYELLEIYKTAYSETIAKDPNHLAKIAEYETLLDQLTSTLDEYEKNTYNPAIEKKLEIDKEYAEARQELKKSREVADELVEKVVSVWREDEEVKKLVNTIQESVTYNYAKVIDSDKVAESTENQNSAFLVISVSVEHDEETADMLVENIKKIVPAFVEKQIERITGTNEVHCTLISTFTESEDISEISLVKNIVSYAVAIAIIVTVLASIVIIIKGVLPADLFEKKEKKAKKDKAADKA